MKAILYFLAHFMLWVEAKHFYDNTTNHSSLPDWWYPAACRILYWSGDVMEYPTLDYAWESAEDAFHVYLPDRKPRTELTPDGWMRGILGISQAQSRDKKGQFRSYRETLSTRFWQWMP